MKDGGNMELVIQNVPSTEEGCSYLCAGFNTFDTCKCTGLHIYMFNNGTSYYAMEFVLARFLSFSPM